MGSGCIFSTIDGKYTRFLLSLRPTKTRPKDYKTFFTLISTENEISHAHKNVNAGKTRSILLLNSDVLLILIANNKHL